MNGTSRTGGRGIRRMVTDRMMIDGTVVHLPLAARSAATRKTAFAALSGDVAA